MNRSPCPNTRPAKPCSHGRTKGPGILLPSAAAAEARPDSSAFDAACCSVTMSLRTSRFIGSGADGFASTSMDSITTDVGESTEEGAPGSPKRLSAAPSICSLASTSAESRNSSVDMAWSLSSAIPAIPPTWWHCDRKTCQGVWPLSKMATGLQTFQDSLCLSSVITCTKGMITS